MPEGLMQDKVALIAGVGEGLGRDLALEFARHGAKLVLAARRTSYIQTLAAEIEALGRPCLPLCCDITKPDDCERATIRTCKEFGRIDSLVSVAYLTDNSMSLLDNPADFRQWREVFDVNVFGTLGLTRAAAQRMVERRSGTIVLINSMAAERLRVNRAAYAGSKAALATMAKVVALELGPYNVRINSLHPGFMGGQPVEDVLRNWGEQNGTDIETERRKVVATIPLNYIPPTSEYARNALFLASDYSAPMTGQSVHSNGGQWLR
jgi:NAD(P)-dependent dehydrogenase (short-subunit alcohol dehydrogenase family)